MSFANSEYLAQRRAEIGVTADMVARLATVRTETDAPRKRNSKAKPGELTFKQKRVLWKAQGLTCLGEPRVHQPTKMGLRRDDPEYQRRYVAMRRSGAGK